MTTETGDKDTQAKALDALKGSPQPERKTAKPGEYLDKTSGLPEKFLWDYNQFQANYNKWRDNNPELYDRGQHYFQQLYSILQERRDQAKAAEKLQLQKPPDNFQRSWTPDADH